MLPRFEVAVSVQKIDAGMLRVIWLDEVAEEGIGDNRMYIDLTGVDWAEVEEVITAAEELINAADSASSDEAGFERVIGEMMDRSVPGRGHRRGPAADARADRLAFSHRVRCHRPRQEPG
jgi:hypothetical protein